MTDVRYHFIQKLTSDSERSLGAFWLNVTFGYFSLYVIQDNNMGPKHLSFTAQLGEIRILVKNEVIFTTQVAPQK